MTTPVSAKVKLKFTDTYLDAQLRDDGKIDVMLTSGDDIITTLTISIKKLLLAEIGYNHTIGSTEFSAELVRDKVNDMFDMFESKVKTALKAARIELDKTPLRHP